MVYEKILIIKKNHFEVCFIYFVVSITLVIHIVDFNESTTHGFFGQQTVPVNLKSDFSSKITLFGFFVLSSRNNLLLCRFVFWVLFLEFICIYW